MNRIYTCIYCHGPCTIDKEFDKLYLNCKNCGKKEATKLLKARLDAQYEHESER